MYVATRSTKARPYDPLDLPPYRGPALPPVPPGADGHFDHLEPGDARVHGGAHVRHAALRARRLGALFRRRDPVALRRRLRRGSSWCRWSTGTMRSAATASSRPASPGRGARAPPVLPQLRRARPRARARLHLRAARHCRRRTGSSAEYLAFHESAADCMAMIAVLHFDSVVDELLRALPRQHLPAERAEPHRRAVRHRAAPARQPFAPAVGRARPATPAPALTQPQRHGMGLPLTGRGVRHAGRGLPAVSSSTMGFISPELDELSRQEENAPTQARSRPRSTAPMPAGTRRSSRRCCDARDYVGRRLAGDVAAARLGRHASMAWRRRCWRRTGS